MKKICLSAESSWRRFSRESDLTQTLSKQRNILVILFSCLCGRQHFCDRRRFTDIHLSLRKQGITIRKPVDCMIHGLFTKLMRPGGILLGTLIFATLLTACRSSAPIPYKIETTYHAAGGYTVDTMTGNRLGDDEGYELNAARYSGKDGTVNYALGVFYSGEQWMFIEPGVSLILWVDSHRFGLKGQGSLRDRKSMGNGYVREIAKYPVAPEILQKMATAGAVKIQIIGRNFVTQKFFTSQNLENFREFVDTYVK